MSGPHLMALPDPDLGAHSDFEGCPQGNIYRSARERSARVWSGMGFEIGPVVGVDRYRALRGVSPGVANLDLT